MGLFANVRPGERGPVLAMTVATALVLVAYYFLKPARDSLFLSQASPAQLPIAFMLAAVVAAPLASFHAKLSRRWSLIRVAIMTLTGLAVSLVLLRWLLNAEGIWIPYLLYAWAGLAGALATSQLWLLTGSLFDAGQAKRVYPIIGLGAIAGAMAGGEATNALISIVGLSTEDLLTAAALVLLLDAGLIALIWRRWAEHDPVPRRRRSKDNQTHSGVRTVRSILSSRLLTYTVAILALEVVIASFVDYQFKTIAWNSYSDPDALAAFLGRFYGAVSLLSLLLQIGLAGRLMSWFGVGGLLAGLPTVLMFGAGALLVTPSLMAAMFLRGGDLGLKHSLERTGRELLFLPISLELKKRTKLFIDLFIDRWFRGIAGAMLLVLTSLLGLSIRWLSIPVLIMAGVWLGLVMQVRREYAGAFRDALARREIDPDEIQRHIDDDNVTKMLVESLRTGGVRRILYALRLVPAIKGLDPVEVVHPLVNHSEPSVRAGALKALSEIGDVELRDHARSMITDSDADVRIEACGYLAGAMGNDRIDLFRECLLTGNPLERNAAAGWIAKYGQASDMKLITETVVDRLLEAHDSAAEDARSIAARLLATVPHESAEQILTALLVDPSPDVACTAIASLVQRGGDAACDEAITRLGDRRLRVAARLALVARGKDIVPRLVAEITNGELDPLGRRQIVRALGELGGPDAALALLALGTDDDHIIRGSALMALARIRAGDSTIQIARDRIDDLLYRSLKAYYGLFQARYRLKSDFRDGMADRLLLRSLDEVIERTGRDAFVLLALRYPMRDIRNTWLAARSHDRHRRANAVEFLSQLLDNPWRSRVVPVLGGLTDRETWEAGRREFKLVIGNPEDALRYLLGVDDPWLRACAVYVAGQRRGNLTAVVASLSQDASPLVRETVTLVSGR